MKRETLQAMVHMSSIACKDENRPHISGVYIKQLSDTKVKIQATNGCMAAIREMEDKIPSGEYILTNDQIDTAKIILNETKNIIDFDCDIDTDKNLIYGFITKGRINASFNYPNLNTIIPKHTHQTSIGLNAEYIQKLADIARKYLGSNTAIARIIFDPTNTENAVIIEGGDHEDLKMILAPMKDYKIIRMADENKKLIDLALNNSMLIHRQNASEL
jgi:hypothetical protein